VRNFPIFGCDGIFTDLSRASDRRAHGVFLLNSNGMGEYLPNIVITH